MAPSFIIAAPTWVTSLRKWPGALSRVEAFDKFQLLLKRKEPLMPTSPGLTSIARKGCAAAEDNRRHARFSQRTVVWTRFV